MIGPPSRTRLVVSNVEHKARIGEFLVNDQHITTVDGEDGDDRDVKPVRCRLQRATHASS